MIVPLLPPHNPMPTGDCPQLPDRTCLTGIIFVLESGMAWEMLPYERGCGSDTTRR